jgi:glycosyltransferase involved in cell wall biosynthesis
MDGRSLQGEPTGVGTYTSNLLEQLLLLDPDLTVGLFASRDLPALGYAGAARVEILKTPDPLHNNLLWSNLSLRRQLRPGIFDLFHSPGYTLPVNLPIPSVVTIHDVSYAARPEWYPHKNGALRRAWYRRSARSADCILTDSEFSRREIVRVYGIPEDKIRVVQLGIDRRRFYRVERPDLLAGVRKKYHLPGECLLFVGDIHRRRNVHRLLEAFAAVRQETPEFPNLTLVLVGRILEPALLPGNAAQGPHAGSVRVLGYVPAEDLPLLYGLARAFVFPSLYEGFGLGVLEAMACGCPVIVGKDTACEEVAGTAGICVDPNNTRSLADAVAAVLRNPDLAAQCSGAGLRRSEAFSWARAAQETQAVYRHVLRKD